MGAGEALYSCYVAKTNTPWASGDRPAWITAGSQAEWRNMKKEFQGLEEDLEAGKHMESPRSTPRHYQIGKHKAVMTYMDSGFKNSKFRT